MNKDKTPAIRVFQKYGFEYKKEFSSDDTLVFIIRQAFFDNAAVLKLKNTSKNDTIEELKRLGYAVKEHKFTSIEDLEKSLFDAFFSTKRTRLSFLNDYKKYTEKVLQSFPIEARNYSYIAAPFTKNSNSDHDNQDDEHQSITDNIIRELKSKKPKLILIEAAAGFGKTSTAFEIGKKISENEQDHLVLFAELSRDRQAKVFKHILHHELDRSFPSLSADLVIDSIQQGRITVILDGFDELLKSNEEENQFEKSEAMLETIGEILTNNSKVILTTRKTALLQGDEFHNWVDSHETNFSVIRYTLHEPSISDWLPLNKIEALSESGIEIKNIANPVLLTYLNYLSDTDFQEISVKPDLIVERYFNSMLEREQDRQELRMSIESQVNLLTRLTEDMIRRNYTKDTRENIIKHFLTNETETIDNLRQNYPATTRPTRDELANRFANHALLDRSSSDEKIGFINDFALGNFVSNSALTSLDNEWAADEIFVEAAVTAYSPRSFESRKTLWKKLSYSRQFIDEKDQIKLEAALLKTANCSLNGQNISNTHFDNIVFFQHAQSKDCIYYECTFKDCTFTTKNITNNNFICCNFYNCTFSDEQKDTNTYISCYDHNGEIIKKTTQPENLEEETKDTQEIALEFILEKFWPKGKDSITFAHRPLALFYSKNNNRLSSSVIEKAITELDRRGLIIEAKRKNWIGIDTSKLNEIAKILGRAQ